MMLGLDVEHFIKDLMQMGANSPDISKKLEI